MLQKSQKYFNYCYALPYYLPIFHGLTTVMSENLDISIIMGHLHNRVD